MAQANLQQAKYCHPGQEAENRTQGYDMKVKFNFADARTVADFVVGGDLGTVVLCKVKQAKWYLTDIRGYILFTGSTRKSCLLELDHLITRGKADEVAAEAAAAKSVADARKSVTCKSTCAVKV